MKITVLYEDNDTLVVDKPVGTVVNRAETIKVETIQDWAEKQSWFPQTEDRLYMQRSGICHRLDKETSGCLILAKSPEALVYYLSLFKKRDIHKTYEALVHGKVEPRHGEVVLPLARSMFDREKWQVHYEGKRAVSEWQVEKYYALPETPHWQNTVSLLNISLKTGRTHQIRVHFSFLGWPLFADEKYLNKEQSEKDRKQLVHHYLYAKKIEFITFNGKKVRVEAKRPADCQKLLGSLMLE